LSGVNTLGITTSDTSITWNNSISTLNITSSDKINVDLPLNSVFYVNAAFTGVDQTGGLGFKFSISTTSCTFHGNTASVIISDLVGAQTCVINGILISTGIIGPSIKFTYQASEVITNGGCSAVIYTI
jgi:hypothetical protein